MDLVPFKGSKSVYSHDVQLFSMPGTNLAFHEKRFVIHTPVSDTLSPVEFVIPASDQFIDLNRSYFKAKVRIRKANNTNIANTELGLFPTINGIHSMIKKFTARWNGTLLNPMADSYADQAYLSTLFDYSSREAGTLLATEGWWPPDLETGLAPIDPPAELTINKLTTNAVAGVGADHANFTALKTSEKAFVRGMVRAREKIKGGKWTHYSFKPMHEIFYSQRILPPGIEQKYMFELQNANFYLNGADAAGVKNPHKDDFKFEFHMVTVRLNPLLYRAISSARHTRRLNVKITTSRTEIRNFTLPANIVDFNEGNLWQGRIPQRMVVGLRHPDCVNGNLLRYPYAFEKFGLISMKQLIKGEEYPYRELVLNQGDGDIDDDGYFRLLQAGGFKRKVLEPMVTPEMWGHQHQCTLFVFDNTAGSLTDGPSLNPRQHGDARLIFKLGANVNHAINITLYAQFENVITIDPNGAVLYDVYT